MWLAQGPCKSDADARRPRYMNVMEPTDARPWLDRQKTAGRPIYFPVLQEPRKYELQSEKSLWFGHMGKGQLGRLSIWGEMFGTRVKSDLFRGKIRKPKEQSE
ncbi:hypothetical protein PISMIDRAFT_460603 [Pisolithus microcarpus 441]|uniref:Uncharacterized protein n=1 Tax=Pisolithus microcarpus 441 TaxID=765257 RepID=A0A0C9Z320_9AGAM|nr:hypothetical protein PISMIDRAFT_460603 [Pisolithus microcarpus 441]